MLLLLLVMQPASSIRMSVFDNLDQIITNTIPKTQEGGLSNPQGESNQPTTQEEDVLNVQGESNPFEINLHMNPLPRLAGQNLTKQFTLCYSIFAWSTDMQYALTLSSAEEPDETDQQSFSTTHEISAKRIDSQNITVEALTRMSFDSNAKIQYNITNFPEWIFLCYRYDLANKKLTVKVSNLSQTFDLRTSNVSFPDKAKIEVGILRGKLSNIKMFGTTPEVKDIECTTNGTYFLWDESLWAGTKKPESRFESTEVICLQSTQIYLRLTSQDKSKAEAEALCKSFANGKLLTISTEEDKNRFAGFYADLMQGGKVYDQFWVNMELESEMSPSTSVNAGIILNTIKSIHVVYIGIWLKRPDFSAY